MSSENRFNDRRPSTFLWLSPVSSEDRKRSTFLSLAPATSASYPQRPVTRGSVSSTSSNEPEIPIARKASVSSGGPRILKLGPVHWGEHLDEHKEDFHESPSSP
ncbi:hypothetical protein N3K66_005590 [Trichothecium roseum]|uniref:Uncharacterized protein n=1 Tax=Trichothecium roseum TaxID=47278 RepID=A0ACC0UYB4_9HYPO|nr:hypothetical protein N3K66_005590 [Trichothecium roseum]